MSTVEQSVREWTPLKKSPPMFPGRPSFQTLWRWTTVGVGGVVLKTIKVGRKRFTCAEWVEEFIRAQNAETLPGEPTAPQRAKQSATARKVLREKYGV